VTSLQPTSLGHSTPASGAAGAPGFSGYLLQQEELRRRRERRTLRWALGLSLALHALLLAVTVPTWSRPLPEVTRSQRVYVVRSVRFRAPPPKAPVAAPRSRQAKRIPIPDPTPDEPEPILRDDELALELEPSDVDVASVFGIPEGPPGPPGLQGRLPLEVGGGVAAPVKIYAPPPRYTEEARLARVQGVVVLRTVIDMQGNVVQAEVLRGLTKGLSESAVQTVSEWKFKPATRAGEPVPVYFIVTISFSIQ